MSPIEIRQYVDEDAPNVAQNHGSYMADEGFDDTFVPLVSGILADFSARDPNVERGWIAQRDGQVMGCIFCVRVTDTRAKLRMFLVDPAARGTGLGRKLLDTCMQFARDSGYTSMELWTHESHEAACALYIKTGWKLVSSKPVTSFGVNLIEQSWDVAL